MATRSTHVQQHYVPEFLLKQWHAGVDQKLVQYSWTPRGLDIQRFKAKFVAKEPHLYSTTLPSGERDVSIERTYLGPKIDDKAAPIFYRLLAGGSDLLNMEEREIWTRFLIAQMVRIPSMIRRYQTFTQEVFASGVEDIASRPGRSGFRDYVNEHGTHVGANTAVEILEDVIESDLLKKAILNASWSLLQLRWSKLDLLIGDRPLLQVGPMSNNFLVAIPLSPRALFCVASNGSTIKRIRDSNQTALVRTINKDSVSKSSRYVYAKDVSQSAVVKKYLKDEFGCARTH